MGNLLAAAKREITAAVFPALFFLTAFELGLVTKALLLEPYEVQLGGIALAAVAALTVTKAILVADQAAFCNIFDKRPLFLAVVWKVMIFNSLVLLFRGLEELTHAWLAKGSLQGALRSLEGDFSWRHFWVAQLWLGLSLLLYILLVELDRSLGRGTIKRLLFGPG